MRPPRSTSTALQLASAIGLLFSRLASADSQRQCYYKSGNPSDDVPCSNDTSTSCCGQDSVCLSNGLCFGQGPSSLMLSRGSCTDRTWGDSCPQVCLGSGDNPDAGLPVVPISVPPPPQKPQYCCGYVIINNDGDLSCIDQAEPFFLEPATVVVGVAALANVTYVDNTVSPAVNTSVSAGSATPASNSTNLPAHAHSGSISKGTTVGAAVGACLGALSLAAIGWAIAERWMRKKQANHFANMDPQTPDGSTSMKQPEPVELPGETRRPELMDARSEN